MRALLLLATTTRNHWQGLILFGYLQILDLLTTVAFLSTGVKEANPLVRWAMSSSPDPLLGLASVKVLAIGIGFTCVLAGKTSLVRKANLAYAALVIWNLVSLIVSLHAGVR
jgi:hypothetical protein